MRADVAGKGTEPPLERGNWLAALAGILAITAVLWIVEIADAIDDHGLDRFGIRPRHLHGLWGVLAAPFLHESYRHLASNTIPFVLLGWVVLLSGWRVFVAVTLTVMIVGGLATWAVAPGDQLIIGASAVVFGWLGYLLARAVFARRILWILIAALIAVLFGSLWNDLLPSAGHGISWQGHLCGFLAGILAAAVLHPRRSSRRALRSSQAAPLS